MLTCWLKTTRSHFPTHTANNVWLFEMLLIQHVPCTGVEFPLLIPERMETQTCFKQGKRRWNIMYCFLGTIALVACESCTWTQLLSYFQHLSSRPYLLPTYHEATKYASCRIKKGPYHYPIPTKFIRCTCNGQRPGFASAFSTEVLSEPFPKNWTTSSATSWHTSAVHTCFLLACVGWYQW